MSRLQKTRQALNLLDVSQSSTTSSLDPALSTLSPENAEVLDAIIAKAPDATAFMTVFKAYSDVLQQRGLDPGNDVVYYKQLLKLGVIKGADWGAKWSIVKGQLGFDVDTVTAQRHNGRVISMKFTGLPRSQLEEDVFTLHSHADETETAVDGLRRLGPPLNRPFELDPSSSRTGLIDSLEINSEAVISSTSPPRSLPIRQLLALPERSISMTASEADGIVEAPVRSSTPPLPRFRRNQADQQVPMTMKKTAILQKTARMNDVEAWKKVEQARQLEDAARFRSESLLSMCFRTWQGGLDWIHTTHSQIISARSHIHLQRHFLRWKSQVVRLRQTAERAAEVARLKTQNITFNFWKEQARRRRILQWKEDMRNRMICFKRKREENICSYAWMRWRQYCLSRRLHTRNTLLRALCHWRAKLRQVDNLETLAEDFEAAQIHRTLQDAMHLWSRRVQMRDAEKYLMDKISYRIVTTAFVAWISIFQDNHRAGVCQTGRLLRQFFEAWRRAMANNLILDSRGDKHLKRRNDLLLRAIFRVWVARERGHLLERVQNARLSTNALLLWRRRFHEQKLLEERAMSYSQRASRLLLASVFKEWTRRRGLIQHQLLLVEQEDVASLLSRTLLLWRMQLRVELKRARNASMARKYFIERGAWSKWRLILEKKRRTRKLQHLDRERLRRFFRSWSDTARHRRHQEEVIRTFHKRTRRRLFRMTLQRWTNRVVLIKLREINLIEQRDKETLGSAFSKWRDMCLRHVENLSLVNSFQDVKREDTLRRMFIRWLSVARKSRMRRTRLAEREDEARLKILAAAWEAWRDHFRENRLQDLEYQAIIQNQSSLLYSAFTIWQSRSKFVPGIRLYATNLKAKSWNSWRTAIPIAVQARKAREIQAKRVLSTIFNKWKEAHRSKIALKAVARARYLRLPSPGHRTAASVQQAHDTLHLRPLLHRPLRSQLSATPHNTSGTEHASTAAPPTPIMRSRTFTNWLGSRSGLRTAPRDSEVPSPGMDAVSADDRRNRLWIQLRGVQLHGLSDDRAQSR